MNLSFSRRLSNLQGRDSTITGRLCMAFELGDKSWKLP